MPQELQSRLALLEHLKSSHDMLERRLAEAEEQIAAERGMKQLAAASEEVSRRAITSTRLLLPCERRLS